MAELKVKISELNQGTPLSTDIIPYVDLVSGETKKALKSELKGDTGLAATADAGTTTTLAAGQSATVTNVGTTSAAIFDFAIPQGIQGITGATGAKVTSVAFSGNDIVFTLDDSSTVTLTNAKIDLKGDKGDNGLNGADGTNGLDGAVIVSGAFLGDDLVFTLSDSSTVTITGAKTALKGDKGDTGLTGVDWQGAWSAGTYTVTQGVAHNGSSWIATTTTTEEPSISATDWDLIALKGTDGAGSGDVSGPASAVNNNIAVFDSTTGKLIKDGGATLASKQDALGYTAEDVANKKTSITDSDTDYPTGKAVKTALDGKQATGSYEVTTNKENTTLDTSTTKYPTNRLTKEYADGKVEDSITDGHTTVAPSGNAVFDALALKAPLASPTFTGTPSLPTGTTGVTQSANDNSTKIATTAYVDGKTTYTQVINSQNNITASGNAATVPITYRLNEVTNNSAATLTITLATSGAVDGQLCMVKVVDFSAVAQTITWVNTENSSLTAPVISNGSTTLHLTTMWQFNSATSKWRFGGSF